MKQNDEPPVVKIALGPVSIQWLETDPGPCECGREIGSGPVGFMLDDPRPLCDVCLLDLHKDLGMLLWIAHIARELADEAGRAVEPAKADSVLLILMKFAQIYHQGAQWPARPAAAKDCVQELEARLPWPAMIKSLTAPPS